MARGKAKFRRWIEMHPYDGYSMYYYKKFYRLNHLAEVISALCGVAAWIVSWYFGFKGFLIVILVLVSLVLGLYVGELICISKARKLKKEIDGDSKGQYIFDQFAKDDPETAEVVDAYIKG